jgi:hypothetical protein
MVAISDPRIWPPAEAAPAHAAVLHTMAEASLGGRTARESDLRNAEIVVAFGALIRAGDGDALAQVLASAPSAAIHRHLWRQLVLAEAAAGDDAMAVTLFALPIILVAGIEGDRASQATLPCVLDDVAALATTLREHGALSGNQNFALAPALVAADAIDIPRLPALLTGGFDGVTFEPRELAPAPIELTAADARVFLRFVVGVAIASRDANLLRDERVGGWGMPFARALDRMLAQSGVTLLALPHAPRRLVTALQNGRAAQREVSAQLFASNAIRKLRATVGEPAAVISAHRAIDSATGGELRLSLSSVFDAREAEGFRCPLYPADHAGDVADMLVTLMRDCRLTDVRVLSGVYGDRDAASGMPLLFKADALPDELMH